MLSSLLLILGVGVLTVALRSFHNVLAQKLSVVGLLTTSYLAGWLLTGSVATGIACACTWLLLPWLEILTRVRRLRLPMDATLRRRQPPPDEEFPALDDLTAEIEREGFAHAEDAGWDWEGHRQFFRLFYHPKERTLAAICLIEQQELAYYYLSLSSRTDDGRVWTTWNYPFAYTLMIAPRLVVNRLSPNLSFPELRESHHRFLSRHRMATADLQEIDPDQLPAQLQQDLHEQLFHNLARGVLTPAEAGKIRYSWRGFFFLWFQFLRDLVRLS